MTLLEKVKANLILEHSEDDELLQLYITTAVKYAESYQHLSENFYADNQMPYNRTSSNNAVLPLYESCMAAQGLLR